MHSNKTTNTNQTIYTNNKSINTNTTMNTNNTNKRQLTGVVNGSPVYASEFLENKFPYETVYPKVLADLINELYDKSGFPIPFSGGSLLMAFSTAIGSTTQLKFKNNFIVFANLYSILIGAPGTSKSHPISYMFKPIREKQAMYYKEFQEEMEKYKFYESMSKQNKESLADNTKPKLRIITLDNFTLETLLQKLSENPKGISIIVDEILAFIDNMNRYNSNGSDSETYNSLGSGLPLRVDRKTTDSYYIPPTAVSVFGTIQPDVLANIFSKGKDKSGFTARFLYFMPENLKLSKWTFNEVNEDLYNQYSKAIHKLLNAEFQMDENGDPIPNFVKFTEEAFNRMVTWHNGDEFYEKIIEDKGNTYYEAFVKLDNYALRLALILQMIYASVENESPNEVGIRAVENAILLVNYFMKEVIKVHNLIYKKDIRLGMSEKQREVYELLSPRFYLCQVYDKVSKIGFTKDQMKKFVGVEMYFTRISRGLYSKNFFELSDD